MRAGQLRHVLTIQAPTDAVDPQGGITQTWQTVVRPWGSLEAIADREYFQGAQIQADVDHRVRIRYTPGLTHKMRVTIGDRVFDIRKVSDPDGRRRELELLLREYV